MQATRLVTAALIFLTFMGCQKRTAVSFPPPARPPAPVVALEQADRAFSAGSYAEAMQGYEDYLRLAPSGGQRDNALFRLGLSYALRTAPAPDWQRATAVLRQLVEEHPQSPLKPPADLILSLHSDVESARSEVESARSELESARSETQSVRSELDEITSSTKQRDERIRQLTTELERLKRIDADRRRGSGR